MVIIFARLVIQKFAFQTLLVSDFDMWQDQPRINISQYIKLV